MIVEFKQSETWVGEDSIPYTPAKGETTAIVNYANDIQVTSAVTKSVRQYRYEAQGVNITIRNYKTTGIQILIEQYIGGCNLTTSLPRTETAGATLVWTINVDVGGTAEIYYEWERETYW